MTLEELQEYASEDGGRFTVTIVDKLVSGRSRLWYEEKLGETFEIQRFLSEGVYVRTGDLLNTGNIVLLKDIKSINKLNGSNL